MELQCLTLMQTLWIINKGIKVFGYWGWQKVTDLLPTNYIPNQSMAIS